MYAIALPEETLHDFCQRWGIREFALFGSVLRDDFRPDSDIDVLVRFHEDVHRTLYDLSTMTDELEVIFGHKVDILTRKSIENSPNYIRRKEILSTLQVIYAE
jgi:predicted nucleotidyltransferase